MKIAFIVFEFPHLSETAILNQVTGLLRRGHHVDIYATKVLPGISKFHADVEEYNLFSRTYCRGVPSNKIERLLQGATYIAANFYKKPIVLLKLLNIFKYGKAAAALWKLCAAGSFLDKGAYDIIHCHYGTAGEFGVLLKETGVVNGKLVIAFHGNDISRYVKEYGDNIYDEVFEKGDLFLPVSEHWKQKLIRLGCDARKIVVHRAGINLERFPLRLDKVENNSQIRLLTVGRLVEKKGVEYSIRAVAKIVNKYPGLKYNIVGDGSLRDNLECLVKELEVGNNIEFFGAQEQEKVSLLMQNADIFLAPSITSQEGDQEGIPATLMEAMACGLPVLSTLHSGIPELVQDGKSGFLVPERNVEALAEKLEYLLNHQKCWSEMGLAGRKYVEQNHDINKLNGQLERIYKQLLNS